MRIRNKPILIEVDTGAASSFISQKEYSDKFSHLLIKPYCLSKFITVTGQSLQVVGKIKVDVVI